MAVAPERISPEFARFSIASSYGEIYDQPGLDLPQRQLVTIAALATMGGYEPQLERRVLAGLGARLTREQVVETCIQIAMYAGHAHANDALRAAGRAFEKW
jgi:4-carboxymuconolactone decarboxylase